MALITETKRFLFGYPIAFDVEYSPAAGLVQTVAPGVLARTLREGHPIELRIDHDAKKVAARTSDGSLKLTVDSVGVRAECAIPEGAVGDELAAALDAGQIAGGSFGWRPIFTRWRVDGDPVRVEIRDALVSEVSIILKPKKPRFVGTWAGELRGADGARWAKLDADRRRFGIRPPEADARPADLVITAPKPTLATLIDRWFEDSVVSEWGLVRRAAEEHRDAKIIDVYRPRHQSSVWDALKRQAARLDLPFKGQAWAIETLEDRVAKRKAAATPTRKDDTMNDDDRDGLLERRPAPGSRCSQPEDFSVARRSFAKARAAFLAVGDRPPLGKNGHPQVWNEARGWHDDEPATSRRPQARPGARSLQGKLARIRHHEERMAEDLARMPGTVLYLERRLAKQAAAIEATDRQHRPVRGA